MKKYIVMCSIALFILLLNAGILYAACTVSTTPVSFGSYNVLLATPLDATGGVTVSCTQNANVTILIGASPNSGGFNPRMMKLATGSELISYNFYIDASHTQIWGDGSGSSYTKNNQVRKSRPWLNTIYGRIPPAQNVSAGAYNETLTVTINY